MTAPTAVTLGILHGRVSTDVVCNSMCVSVHVCAYVSKPTCVGAIFPSSTINPTNCTWLIELNRKVNEETFADSANRPVGAWTTPRSSDRLHWTQFPLIHAEKKTRRWSFTSLCRYLISIGLTSVSPLPELHRLTGQIWKPNLNSLISVADESYSEWTAFYIAASPHTLPIENGNTHGCLTNGPLAMTNLWTCTKSLVLSAVNSCCYMSNTSLALLYMQWVYCKLLILRETLKTTDKPPF